MVGGFAKKCGKYLFFTVRSGRAAMNILPKEWNKKLCLFLFVLISFLYHEAPKAC